MKAINPANGQLIGEYKEHSDAQMHQILAGVDKAFLDWRHSAFSERSRLMNNAAAVLRRNREKYARLMSLEMGKVIRESRAEVDKCAWVCEYYAENSEAFLSDEIIESDASRSFVSFSPLGTILAVMPWNFPFWQVFRFAAPALMAGNGAVLKHASNVPGSALAIEEIFRDAGFPENLLRTMLIGSGKVETVLRDNRIKAVTLTGSEPAGSKVASIAGSEIKKSVLELGGSDPFIVLEDADILKCAATAVQARMLNAGQSCIAAKRFIVVETCLKEFEDLHVQGMKALSVGDPLNESSDVGPLARPDLVADLDRQVQQSLKKGARLLTGGQPVPGPGTFYEPTVLSAVKPGMAVYDEETFGPVTAIISVKDEQEALQVANDSQFGLGASVWSQNIDKAVAFARKVESGGVFINGMTKSDPRLPFGGIKKSGYGRELSHYGIKEFVNVKTISIS